MLDKGEEGGEDGSQREGAERDSKGGGRGLAPASLLP